MLVNYQYQLKTQMHWLHYYIQNNFKQFSSICQV